MSIFHIFDASYTFYIILFIRKHYVELVRKNINYLIIGLQKVILRENKVEYI